MRSTQIIDPKSFFQRSQRSQRGQDLAEYALLFGFIAIAVIAGVIVLGQQLAGVYESIIAQLTAIF
jgi:Flp pilus assembly pilin Flp